MPKKIKFKCSKCGKRGIFGEHFCDSRNIAKYQEKLNYDPDADLGYDDHAVPRKTLNIAKKIYATAGIVGLLVLAAFSYQLFGGFALLGILGLAIVISAVLFSRKLLEVFSGNSRELLALCRGDSDLVQRLVRAEQLRQPGISRRQASKLATKKLLADRLR